MKDLNFLSIKEASSLLQKREIKSIELVQACINQIQYCDHETNAFITLCEEQAKETAKLVDEKIEKKTILSHLEGIPVGLKDIYDTANVLTTCHSKLFKNRVPLEDCTAWRRLANAGAILLGKTSTHEFASGGPSFDLPWPPARNPWNTKHIPSGSSSGSGAAVAAGMAFMATGSDTGGSIRGPAGVNGLSGLKPSYGLVSRRGVFPLSWTLDHVGPLCRTTEDCALTMEVLAGYDKTDPSSVNLQTLDFTNDLNKKIDDLKIGLCSHWFETNASAATQKTVQEASDTLRSLGADVVPITLPKLEDFHACGRIILLSEAYAIHRKWLTTEPDSYGDFFRLRTQLGAFIGADQYVDALRWKRKLAQELKDCMNSVDLVLTANEYEAAPLFEDSKQDFHFFDKPSLTMPGNVSGQPALTIRGGFSDNGLPLGIQLIGHYLCDPTVLRVGHQFEKARPDLQKWPVLKRSENNQQS